MGVLGTKTVSMKDLLGLPADPDKLKTILLSMSHGQPGPEATRSGSADLWLFLVARDLVTGLCGDGVRAHGLPGGRLDGREAAPTRRVSPLRKVVPRTDSGGWPEASEG
jgi:hypothetical protein